MSSLDAGYSTDTTTTLTRARAGFWRRFAAAFIDGILLGYLWMLWDSEKQCWHDKAANDVVIPTR